ncbi:uncharacterized protein LODBEIA_P00880 [Lodderomyces beijingensis]|uniref:RING-type E3 ubiquitin transferase n=1 Tax=Lodderomyces beijingensis TaxID=1775926 RepID=A0ABP0ZCE0_9ASCO
MAVDRGTLIFFIIMFIFLSLPSGNEQPHSDLERDTLQTYQSQLSDALVTLEESEYALGYGNITGYQLSYEDHLKDKKVKDWPIHKFSKDQPWVENQDYSILPNAVSDKVRQFWGKDFASKEGNAYLLNISGRADGVFEPVKKKKVKAVEYPIPTYLKHYYDSRTSANEDYNDVDGRSSQVAVENHDYSPSSSSALVSKVGNITAAEGLISIMVKGFQYNFNEPEFHVINETDRISTAVVATIELNLKDYSEVEDHSVDLKGVYFQDTGSLLATSNSAKFFGSYGLSHLSMDAEKFAIAKTLMHQFNNVKNDKDVTLDDMNQSILKSLDQCEFIAYLQFNKTAFTHDELRYVDSELKTPTGRPLPHEVPQLSIGDFLVYSPDCGIVLKKKPDTVFTGRRSEVLRAQMKNVLTGLLVLVFMQLFLILRQVGEARTPGQLSVISSKTLFLLGFEDSLLAIMSLLLSTVSEDLYLLLACIATIAFMSCGIFEMRFMVSVLTTQANETGTTWWEIMRGASPVPFNSTSNSAPNTGTSENSEGPILPIANPPPPPPPQTQAQAQQATPQAADPVPNQAWQETSYSNSIFASGFTLTIIAMFLVFSSLNWRLRYRIAFEYVCLIFINSFWLPQFFRNTLKNRRKAFTWQFVLGSSAIRVIPIYYFALYKANPLRHRYDPILCIVVTSWLLLQIFLLFLQNTLGARFWINENWLPKAYDYQQVLTLRNLQEDGFSIDLLANFKHKSSTEIQNGATAAADARPNMYVECECTCPICMTDVALPIIVKDDVEESSKRKNQILSGVKKDYMITPCHHIFHVECLESWMKYKLQCPVCRTSLPPI